MISSKNIQIDGITNLNRKKQISSSHIPNNSRVSLEVSKSLQRVIQFQLRNKRMINNKNSSHINNNDYSTKQSINNIKLNHDINIDMRRSKLNWINREFPRQIKQNLNKNFLGNEMAKSSLERLKNYQDQYQTRVNRSLSSNISSTVQERAKDSLLQRQSLKIADQLQQSPLFQSQFFSNKKYEIISNESQNFSFNSRYSLKLSDQFSFDKITKQNSEVIILEEDLDIPLIQQRASMVELNLLGKDSKNNQKVQHNQYQYKLQLFQNVIKFENKSLQNEIQSYLKPKVINFNTTLEHDKYNKNENNSIQSTQSNSINQEFFEKSKLQEFNEDNQILSSQDSIIQKENNQIQIKNQQSNFKYSHLKNLRYIDYVNFQKSTNYHKINESQRMQERNNIKSLSSISKANVENYQINSNTQIHENYQTRINQNNFDLQKLEINKLKKRISRSLSNSKFQNQSNHQQTGIQLGLFPIPHLSLTNLNFENQVSTENSLSFIENNSCKHSFIRKYLKLKQNQSRKSYIENLSLINRKQSNYQSKIFNQKDSQIQSVEQKQINKNIKDTQQNQIQSKQQQINNETYNSIPPTYKQSILENHSNQYLKEIKSFKNIQKILNKQTYYRNQCLQPLNKSLIKQLPSLNKHSSSNQDPIKCDQLSN